MSLLFLHKVSTGQFLKEKEGEGRGVGKEGRKKDSFLEMELGEEAEDFQLLVFKPKRLKILTYPI